MNTEENQVQSTEGGYVSEPLPADTDPGPVPGEDVEVKEAESGLPNVEVTANGETVPGVLVDEVGESVADASEPGNTDSQEEKVSTPALDVEAPASAEGESVGTPSPDPIASESTENGAPSTEGNAEAPNSGNVQDAAASEPEAGSASADSLGESPSGASSAEEPGQAETLQPGEE